jgi:aspartokinase/homoserine dehydrogenase 1
MIALLPMQELWSTQILTALLQFRHHQGKHSHHFIYVDARNLITVQEDESGNNNNFEVAWDISQRKLSEIVSEADRLQRSNNESTPVHLIMTGYVAVNTDGVATTLQRDGSDYSASILGRLLKATAINIWTDVDGVLSADPRRVPQANVIPEVSYNEAMELAYFGAKVRSY